jgi:histidine transport system permease protein
MIELLQQYGLAYLYSDGSGFSGLAMTLWLFVVSMVLGLLLSLPLALARTSRHAWLRCRCSCTPTCSAARRCISSC